MLKAINVTKKFGELVAVDNLSFEVQEGQVYGIAGPNGAGKSTVFNLITGFYPYEGRIEFEGRNLSGLSPDRITREGIARTFQIPQFFPSLTVKKSISVGSRFGTQGGLDPRHVAETIRFVGLEAEQAGQLRVAADEHVQESRAECRRHSIIRGLVGKANRSQPGSLTERPRFCSCR